MVTAVRGGVRELFVVLDYEVAWGVVGGKRWKRFRRFCICTYCILQQQKCGCIVVNGSLF